MNIVPWIPTSHSLTSPGLHTPPSSWPQAHRESGHRAARPATCSNLFIHKRAQCPGVRHQFFCKCLVYLQNTV